MNQTPPPPLDDDDLRGIMLERLSITAARGGLEMEEKLKTIFVGLDIPSCSFVFPKGRDHHLYKQKIAEYTKSPPLHSPPPLPPGLVAQCDFKSSLTEQVALNHELFAFKVRVPEGGMMRKELAIIKFTAQFVVRYGRYFWWALRDRVSTDDTQFKFLDKGGPRYHFFSRICLEFGHLIRAWEDPPASMEALLEVFFTAFNAFKKKLEDDEELVEKVKTDRRDFVVCDEYFVDPENKALELIPMAMRHPPLNEHHSQGTFRLPPDLILFRVEIPAGGMMRKELGVIKFTALFVVRYGNEFWDALWDRVSTDTQFKFLEKNPGNDRGRYTLLFSQFLLAYGNVIKPWGLMPRKSNPPARMEAVLEGFFTAFNAFKKKQEDEEDEVVNKVVTDRRDFVVCEEYFQYFLDMEESTPRPEMLPRPGSLFARPPPVVQPPPLHEKPEPKRMMHPPPPLLEEPEGKRGKLDESAALVSEEEFLAQHPGSSTIMICVTNANVIQITVPSLSVNVGSLKGKIAEEMGIPANQQKLTGKTGVLKDDMSLAHYNLGAEEKLTLTC